MMTATSDADDPHQGGNNPLLEPSPSGQDNPTNDHPHPKQRIRPTQLQSTPIEYTGDHERHEGIHGSKQEIDAHCQQNDSHQTGPADDVGKPFLQILPESGFPNHTRFIQVLSQLWNGSKEKNSYRQGSRTNINEQNLLHREQP
jgi:hypothetical protein